MEKYAYWKRNKEILLALGLTLGLMAAFKLFGVLVYDTNDDTIMASLSYGYYGVPEEKLIYIHPLLGTFLAALQRTVPAFPWYYLVELGILGLSITALYWMVLRKKEIKQVLPELAVLTVLLVQTMLFRLQYTKIAGCASAAGMLLMFQAAEDRRRWWGYLPGILLSLLGFCLRDTAFAMVMIPMVGVGMQLLLQCRIKEEKRAGALALCFLSLFALCGLLIWNKNQSYSDAQWQNYQKYNRLRTELMDYGFPDYSENRSLYESLGITEEDLTLYKSWDFGDPERFTVGKMQALCQAKKATGFSLRELLSSAKASVRGLMSYDFAAGVLVAALLAFTFGGRKSLPLTLYELLALFGAETWMMYTGRGLRERVDGALVISVCMVLLIICCRGTENKMSRRGCALLAAAIVLCQVPDFLARKDDAMERYVGAAHLQAAFQVMSKDKDTFYFTRTDELPPDRMPGRQGDFGYYSNIGTLGGWLTQSPYILERNAAHGIKNPFRDMVNSDSIRLVSNDIQPVLNYICRYYAPNARAIEVDSIRGEYAVWKIVAQ